jgi:uncharacterized membrane protein
MNGQQIGSGESKLESAISVLLIIGVVLSLLLEITGIILLYISYKELLLSQEPGFFIKGSNFFTFLFDQLRFNTGESLSIRLMTIGIVILMLTPFLRVVISAIYFAIRKNIKYTLITLFVLAVLTISLTLH